ncbi:hypothetical protein LguiA_002851 [Lonicera macranthoides]
MAGDTSFLISGASSELGCICAKDTINTVKYVAFFAQQVYDEVILEGPTESAAVAKAIVLDCMSKPFDGENILKLAYLLMPNAQKTGTLPNVCYVTTQHRVLYIRNPQKGTTYQ